MFCLRRCRPVVSVSAFFDCADPFCVVFFVLTPVWGAACFVTSVGVVGVGEGSCATGREWAPEVSGVRSLLMVVWVSPEVGWGGGGGVDGMAVCNVGVRVKRPCMRSCSAVSGLGSGREGRLLAAHRVFILLEYVPGEMFSVAMAMAVIAANFICFSTEPGSGFV